MDFIAWLAKLFVTIVIFAVAGITAEASRGNEVPVPIEVFIAFGIGFLLVDSLLDSLAKQAKQFKPKSDPKPFKLTEREMRSLVWECDDTAGMLVKESTLRFFIERAVNEDRKERAETA